jgi:hypothetical protein
VGCWVGMNEGNAPMVKQHWEGCGKMGERGTEIAEISGKPYWVTLFCDIGGLWRHPASPMQ